MSGDYSDRDYFPMERQAQLRGDRPMPPEPNLNAELVAALREARVWLIDVACQRPGAGEALRIVNAAIAKATKAESRQDKRDDAEHIHHFGRGGL